MNKPKQFGEMLIETLNGAVSREEVVALGKELADTIKKVGQVLNEKTAQHSAELDTALKSALQTLEQSKQELSASVNENKEITKSEARTLKRYIDYEIQNLKGLLDGVAADIPDMDQHASAVAERIAEVEKRIPVLPKERDYSTEINASKEELRAEIAALKQEIASRPVGGVTNARIQQAFKYILKTEQPVGAINGVNLTYTLSQPIFAILSMSLNGETIAQLPNYTINGNTFTFSTALPSDYSGKDWEVKYI
jgi:DNA repair exonuclease SbcCD ATPase subunit